MNVMVKEFTKLKQLMVHVEGKSTGGGTRLRGIWRRGLLTGVQMDLR